jgi:hypothetical protein
MKKIILLSFVMLIIAASFSQNQLIIEGNQIWVRSTPKTGEVVMKLDDGAICRVLKKERSR